MLIKARHFRAGFCLTLVAGFCPPSAVLLAAPLPDDASVLSYVRPAIDSGNVVGMAIGLIDMRPGAADDSKPAEIPGAATRMLGLGRARDDGDAPPTAETLFEIGSVTKVFTGLLLARLAEKEQLAIDDPVASLLPDSVIVPSSDGRAITLADLSTHGSGLPRMPDNIQPKDPANPYADYSVEQMYEFLSGHTLRRSPGAEYEYSNLATGLLGHALALRAGKSYEQLVLDEIATPLGMSRTAIAKDAENKAIYATGHDADGTPVADWDIPTLAGAGALRSSVRDMLRFVAAEIGGLDSPLTAAIRETQIARMATSSPVGAIGLGWHIADNGAIHWHNGQTGGYHSFVGFNREKRIGVVVLANSGAGVIDEIGMGLLKMLDGAAPAPLSVRPSADVDPAGLDTLAGSYFLGLGAMYVVTREGDRLMAQLGAQPKFQLHSAGGDEFFYRVVDARVTFERDDKGRITGLVLHQNGQDMRAPRVPDGPAGTNK